MSTERTRLLIINADDLGYDPEVTRGMIEAMRRGVVTSATLMVNTPFSEEAARAAGGLSLGLHLNLARHPPAWPDFPSSLLERGSLSEARAGALPAEVVEQETLAQLARHEALTGRKPTHLDVHKHLHRHTAVLDGLCRAARARGLPVRAIDPAMRAEVRRRGLVTTDHFLGDAADEAYWTFERFAQTVATLPADGSIELMCHPGHRPSQVKSGYSVQREVELATFVDPRARELLARAAVRLGTFADL